MRALVAVLLAFVGCAPSSPPPSPEPPSAIELPEPTVEDASAPVAEADAALDAVGDWQAELAWARSRFPELADYQLPLDPAQLLGWVPVGQEVSLFLSLDQYRCKPVVASRSDAVDELIRLKIFDMPKLKHGKKVRSYASATAGRWLHIGFGGGEQTQDVGGGWSDTSGWGSSGGGASAALSSVEGDAARFDAEPVRVETSCGPIEQLSCSDGGTRPCNRCSEVKIEYFPLPLHGGSVSRGIGVQPSTCKEPCPNTDNPDLTRLRAVLAVFDQGHRVSRDGKDHVGLYRTLAACNADKGKKRR
jgi:hypothetical protein